MSLSLCQSRSDGGAGATIERTPSLRQGHGDSLGRAMSTDEDPPKTLLITLVGKDRPGVTSAVFAELANAGVEVLDIEQIVLRRRLILGVLVSAPRDWKKLRRQVIDVGEALDLSIDVDRGVGDNKARRDGRSHVTVIGTPLKASAFAAIAGRIADCDRGERGRLQ